MPTGVLSECRLDGWMMDGREEGRKGGREGAKMGEGMSFTLSALLNPQIL